MCGFCGIADFSGAAVEEATLRAMTAVLRHRGPDDAGVFTRGGVGLGHARLSIIDLSAAGHQPMCAGDGAAVIAYNGEVYNFQALRCELEDAGVRFRSCTDTEVVLQGYLHWGEAVFARLNGMFALALWDARSERLVLARDRFGIKPLYYHARGGALSFGSEIKALLASGRVPRELDPQALHEYLWYGMAHGERTLFAGVRKLLPGHLLTADAHGLQLRPFWELGEVPEQHDGLEVASRRVRDLLEAAVDRHLIADVPVGVFLSGGIDSSALTAFASRRVARLQSYAVGFDFDRGINELPKARRVAGHFGTDHHELVIAGGDLPEVLRALVRAHDEPFADAANIPLYLLCRELAGTPKVVLQGDGGDELFAGYRRYNVLTAAALWRVAGRSLGPLLARLPHSRRADRVLRFLRAVGAPDDALRMALLLTVESLDQPPEALLSPALRQRLGGTDPFLAYREAQQRLGGLEPVQRMLRTDLMVLLPNQFLEKVDKSTMAHSVEVRVPFLDAELAQYVLGLPASLKVRRGQKKFVLRRALRGTVPDDILDGPKTGFGVPYEEWLRTSLAGFARQVLTDPATRRAELFDPPVLERMLEEHRSGRREHGFLLWKALQLALWHAEYLDAH